MQLGEQEVCAETGLAAAAGRIKEVHGERARKMTADATAAWQFDWSFDAPCGSGSHPIEMTADPWNGVRTAFNPCDYLPTALQALSRRTCDVQAQCLTQWSALLQRVWLPDSLSDRSPSVARPSPGESPGESNFPGGSPDDEFWLDHLGDLLETPASAPVAAPVSGATPSFKRAEFAASATGRSASDPGASAAPLEAYVERVRRARCELAAEILSRRPASGPAEVFQGADAAAVWAALVEFERAPDSTLVEAILPWCRSSNPLLRAGALWQLRNQPDPRVVERLRAAAGDSALILPLRCGLLAALGRRGDASDAAGLMKFLAPTRPPALRRQAARAAARILERETAGAPEARRAAVRELLEASHDAPQDGVAEVLSQFGEAIVEDLSRLLPTLSKEGQERVVETLARIESTVSVDALLNIYRRRPGLRIDAAPALVRQLLAAPRGAPDLLRLRRLIALPDQDIRWQAAWHLGGRDEAAAIPSLLALLDDPAGPEPLWRQAGDSLRALQRPEAAVELARWLSRQGAGAETRGAWQGPTPVMVACEALLGMLSELPAERRPPELVPLLLDSSFDALILAGLRQPEATEAGAALASICRRCTEPLVQRAAALLVAGSHTSATPELLHIAAERPEAIGRHAGRAAASLIERLDASRADDARIVQLAATAELPSSVLATVRSAVLRIAAKSAGPSSLGLLRKIGLESNDRSLARLAGELSVRFRPPAGWYAEIARLLESGDDVTARCAAEFLAATGDPAVAALAKALCWRLARARRLACEALGAIGAAQARAALEAAVRDRDPKVGRAAGEALARLKPR